MALRDDFLLNVDSLRRVDKHVCEILYHGGQVRILKYDQEDMRWISLEIEGLFFLVRRKSGHEYQFMVLNQFAQNDPNKRFVQPITEELTPFTREEERAPCFNYSWKNDERYSVWFYYGQRSRVVYEKIRCLVHQTAGAAALMNERQRRLLRELTTEIMKKQLSRELCMSYRTTTSAAITGGGGGSYGAVNSATSGNNTAR